MCARGAFRAPVRRRIVFILFDLDGTLLPMDQEKFTKAYFSGLTEYFAPLGYEPKALLDGVLQGTVAMVKNDGGRTNEEVFWDTFAGRFGERVFADRKEFDKFYETRFDDFRAACGYNPAAGKTVKKLKGAGYTVVLATNPVFPMTAQKKRLHWAGADESDFALITSYENSRACKPNVRYYEEILQKLGASASDCIMVGNDVTEDMVAEKLGIKVFLLTDCLINRENKDISVYPHGGFGQLGEFLERETGRI